MSVQYKKYATLLTDYCLRLKKQEKVLVRSSILAEPLLQVLQARFSEIGVIPEFQLSFSDQEKLFYQNRPSSCLGTPSPFYELAIKNFDAIITIRAPINRHELSKVPNELKRKQQDGYTSIREKMMARSAKGDIRWVLCEFPTLSAAEGAKMTLKDYESFIFKGCFISKKDPMAAWKDLSKTQETIVRFLNKKSEFRFVGPKTDIQFSTKKRIWINSDGKRNMPSGEVFTSPVEHSVSGTIYFSYPSRYFGKPVEGVSLEVKDGKVMSWTAKKGKAVLDDVFKVSGARYFGEVAIGTNPHIQEAIGSTLFDEKIGGSVHMAVGASYPETGGKNKSSVHWDLITDMKKGGEIYADGELIYKNGAFICF